MKLIKDLITMYGMYYGGTTHVRPVVSSRKCKESSTRIQLWILAGLLVFAMTVTIMVISGLIQVQPLP